MAAIKPQLDAEPRHALRRSEAEQQLHAEVGVVKVLAVIDGSERTGRVLDYLGGPALRGAKLETVLLNVQPKPEDGRLRGYGSFKREVILDRLVNDLGRRVVSSAGRRLDQAGILHKERIELGDAAKTALRVAQEERCDLILVAEAHPGVVRRWLSQATGVSVGSIASQLVQLADMPVVVVK
jgi:nucleotide-binding universal stress UspA family protein